MGPGGGRARVAYVSSMPHFAVSAIGRDQPGIVAAIAEGLLEIDGNVEDSRMTILGGHFAVMLLVSTDESRDAAAVELALAAARERLKLGALSVSAVGQAGEVRPSPDHVITVYGSDHPGIVHSVSAELAAAGVNITDLQTRLAGAAEAPIYVMMLEVELGALDHDAVRSRLRDVAERASVEVEMRALDAEAL